VHVWNKVFSLGILESSVPFGKDSCHTVKNRGTLVSIPLVSQQAMCILQEIKHLEHIFFALFLPIIQTAKFRHSSDSDSCVFFDLYYIIFMCFFPTSILVSTFQTGPKNGNLVTYICILYDYLIFL